MSAGSNTATCGIKDMSVIEYFSLVVLSLTTAATVVSLPVPAVVGTANKKGILLCTFKSPFICGIVLFGLATLAAIPLAQSMGEPPPKATIPSHLFCL